MSSSSSISSSTAMSPSSTSSNTLVQSSSVMVAVSSPDSLVESSSTIVAPSGLITTSSTPQPDTLIEPSATTVISSSSGSVSLLGPLIESSSIIEPSVSPNFFPLLNLPNELIREIGRNLNGRDIKNLIEVSAKVEFIKPLLHSVFITAIEREFGKRGHLRWAATIGDVKWARIFINDGFRNDEGCAVLQGMGGGALNGTAGWTALHAASMHGHETIVRMLLFRGADIEACQDGVGTPMQCAALFGHINIVELLINRGTNLYARSSGQLGDTALHQAAARGHGNVIELLLNSGFTNMNLQSTYHDGRTALHWAVISGHNDAVKILLENGADPNGQDFMGTNSLHEAASYIGPIGEETPEEYASRGPKPNEAHLQIVGLLMAYGGDALLPNMSGTTTFHLAAQFGHKDMVELLLNYAGAIDYQNDDYETALHKAAEFGHTDLVEMLLSRGAETETVRMDGLTALGVAQLGGHAKVVDLLQDVELALAMGEFSLDD